MQVSWHPLVASKGQGKSLKPNHRSVAQRGGVSSKVNKYSIHGSCWVKHGFLGLTGRQVLTKRLVAGPVHNLFISPQSGTRLVINGVMGPYKWPEING